LPNNLTTIGICAFSNINITNITIPSSVTEIWLSAFDNFDLTSVTFLGTIPSTGFGNAFIGDLREKFYAVNSRNGTPGTYIRSTNSNTWTKQN
jgi:hypothetical protein